MYALTVIMLFRPFRSLEEIRDWCGLRVDMLGASPDSVWQLVDGEYLRWRRQIEGAATKFYDGSADKQPEPLSREW